MKDSWGPLKALAVASVVNAIGDIVLCSFLGYGIAGAAWATMVSQVRTKNFNIDLFQAEYNL
jgi:Na+-driven multidrug efflux pump